MPRKELMVVEFERWERRDGAARREGSGRHRWRNTLKCLERNSRDITADKMDKLDILVVGLMITYGDCKGRAVSKLDGDIETPDRNCEYANSPCADLNPASPSHFSTLFSWT
jgi:hypothetical protein